VFVINIKPVFNSIKTSGVSLFVCG